MLITNNKDALNLAQMTHEFLLTLTGDMYGLQKGLTWIVVDQFLFSPSSITFFRVDHCLLRRRSKRSDHTNGLDEYVGRLQRRLTRSQ